jgi:hypothetical protein
MAVRPGGKRRQVQRNAVCALARVDSRTAKAVIASETGRGKVMCFLSQVIEQIKSGEVRFSFRPWPQGVERVGVEYVRKPARPQIQERLTLAEDHREFARCRTCQGDRWQPVRVHGKLHFACKACWPAGNLAAIGAQKVDPKDVAMLESPMRERF